MNGRKRKAKKEKSGEGRGTKQKEAKGQIKKAWKREKWKGGKGRQRRE